MTASFSGVPSTSAAQGDDLKCRPFRKIFVSLTEKNVNQHAKISDDLFLVIYPKNENFFNRIVPPPFDLCRP